MKKAFATLLVLTISTSSFAVTKSDRGQSENGGDKLSVVQMRLHPQAKQQGPENIFSENEKEPCRV